MFLSSFIVFLIFATNHAITSEHFLEETFDFHESFKVRIAFDVDISQVWSMFECALLALDENEFGFQFSEATAQCYVYSEPMLVRDCPVDGVIISNSFLRENVPTLCCEYEIHYE